MTSRRPRVTWRWNALAVWQLGFAFHVRRQLVRLVWRVGAARLSWCVAEPANDVLTGGRQ
jgi:hypothetical protein